MQRGVSPGKGLGDREMGLVSRLGLGSERVGMIWDQRQDF